MVIQTPVSNTLSTIFTMSKVKRGIAVNTSVTKNSNKMSGGGNHTLNRVTKLRITQTYL